MANNFFIDLTNIKNTERYAMSKFLEFTDNFDPVTSEFMLRVTNLKGAGKYKVQGEDARPDLISYRIYGSTQYWWIIMFYNGIVKVDDIVNGMEIVFPDSGELEKLFFTLKSKELGR
jgi:hypothetical protein